MPQMLCISSYYEYLMRTLADENIPIRNIPHTCLKAETFPGIKKVIRDTLSGGIVYSEEEFYITLYCTEPDRGVSLKRSSDLLQGYDIPQWIIERLPHDYYGPFAVKLNPKTDPQDPNKQKIWVFTGS